MAKTGTCGCCNAHNKRLHLVGTVLGLQAYCAECCKKWYGCKPGFTTDGIKLTREG